MTRHKPLWLVPAFSFVVVFAALAACGDDPVTIAAFDAGEDAGQGDGPVADSFFADVGNEDAAPVDASIKDVSVDTRPLDTTPPAQITTLTATTTGLTSITLSWTAVGDDGTTGTATGYEIRRALTPITTLTEFAAATVVASPPAPAIAGTTQTKLVTGLATATAYHYAIRAHDEVPNQGELSADATATTLTRAQVQISEAAVSNLAAQGYDFVELVALSAGRVDGLVVREASGPLYTFGALTVALGDRIVVHSMGTPCPTGCAQEDVSGNIAESTEPFALATAWDVYATPATAGLSAADNVISVLDETTLVDALALSNRDGDAAVASMTAFAALNTAAGWTFGVPPVDGTTDCATQKDTASIATGATACGGQPGAASGMSIQRNGTTDTNSRKDFFAAPQTMGLANGGNIAPTLVSAVPTSATGVLVTFSEDISSASVTAGAFTLSTIASTTATLSDVNQVTLVFAADQVAGQAYTLAVDATVTDPQGTALVPGSTLICGYSAVPVALLINEVAPNISYTSAQADLIELRVVSGGSVNGITVRANPTATGLGTLLATLPNVCVPAGDLIVVHLHPGNAPGTLPPSSEVLSKTELLNATYAANYDGAWDVVGGSNDISGTTELVLTVLSAPPGGSASPTILDAAAFSSQTTNACAPLATCTTTATYKTALTAIETATQWAPACSASPCDDATLPNTSVVVSASYAGVGNSPITPTVARATAGTDTNAAADWTVGPSTLGSSN